MQRCEQMQDSLNAASARVVRRADVANVNLLTQD